MILILAERDDPHVDLVAKMLKQRGVECARFGQTDFPTRAEMALSYAPNGEARHTLRIDDERIDLSRLRSVWFRLGALPIPHEHIAEKHQRDYVAEECNGFLHDAWHSLECRWVPAPYFVVQRAQLKSAQLRVAATLGFELPPTLITNSPDEFLEFYHQHNGQVISKQAAFALARHGFGKYVRYTNVVSKRDLGYAHAVRYCPLIFQAYVPKRVELRITVVGRKIFPVEIRSQATNHTRHDWRRYDHFKMQYVPHDLPPAVAQQCIQLVEQLGLSYGAIDMILTPDGRYVFLEINPQGQCQWLEEVTGLPITAAICDLLATEASNPIRPEITSLTSEEKSHDRFIDAGRVCGA